ncbi:MAG: phospho-N-acetylmuramoyl-pentapeptide-transferase [Lachnospiraceae bacterium]|nr:phospho-N-acetylmuramoyl-pentapeptide-transferase [Lachnospiraceae bacterium]
MNEFISQGSLIVFLLSFVFSIIIGNILVPFLTKKKVDQTEREIMESHVKKNGTPTMGGFIFLIPVIVFGIILSFQNSRLIPVMIGIVSFAIIGFIDDFLKVVKKKSDGLRTWQKLLLQIVAATILLLYIIYFSDISLQIRVPFLPGLIDIGWIAIPLYYFCVLGTVNGVNLNDGVDAMTSTVTLVVAGFFFVASFITGAGTSDLSISVIGGLLGFLFFNLHPAKIFMGDTGSLALGGYVAAMAYVMNMPLFIIVVGFIYLLEAVSVILQVSYFKISHGKRIFKMTPIHHHFELSGWSEPKVVGVFAAITFILAVVALYAIR